MMAFLSKLICVVSLIILLNSSYNGNSMLLSSSSSSSRRQHRGGAVSARSFSSSLGATTTPGVVDVTKFKQGFINVTRSSDNNGDDGGSSSSTSTHRLCYNIARPMNLSSKQAAPLVVLHGGPSVPSNYLYPLVNVVPYRSIIFYDQLGCGKSDEPTDSTLYSIQNAVTDLKILLNKLNVRRFHLYGQSFGGILAYEYLKSVVACEELEYDEKNDHPQCLSLILSSTPTNVKEVELHVARLIQDLTLSSSSSSEGDKDVNDDDDNINELFRITHQCRLPEMPPLLHEAYANAGSVWRGTSAIADYFAKPPPPTASTSIRKKMPSTLIMRGEYDFVCEESVSQWKTILSSSNTKSVRYKTLQGCSHHGLLEDGMVYGEILDSFCSEYD